MNCGSSLGRVAWGCLVVVGLTGCGASLSDTAVSTPEQGSLRGSVLGGQQPVAGAHIYLYAAGAGGYGGASVSLLKAYSGGSYPTHKDGNGNYYETTDSGGYFDLTNAYTCTPGQQVYLYSIGGNPGLAGNNPALGLMAVLGQCPSGGTFAGTLEKIFVSEISTVAAAYAMSGFATDATDVSSSGTALATVGIANAFANADQLYDIQGRDGSHTARATTPGGNGTVPQSELITLGNILASCINASGALTNNDGSKTACGTLFSTATSDGTATGTNPTETATAAINIAHHPGANPTGWFNLATPNAPFPGSLGSAPNDFSVSLYFTGGGLAASPQHLAIDAAGDMWTVVGGSAPALIELSPLGTVLSGAGYTDPVLTGPSFFAIDQQGYVWVLAGGSVVAKFSSGGVNVSGTGYGTGASCAASGIAVAANGNIWVDNGGCDSLSEFSGQGHLKANSPVSESGYLSGSGQMGIDQEGDIWVDQSLYVAYVNEFSSTGVPAANTPYAVPNGPSKPTSDGLGNTWFANFTDAVTEYSSTGQLLSGANGYTFGTGSNSYRGYDVAIDGGENAWVSSYYSGTIHEFSSGGTPLNGATGYSARGLFGFITDIQVDGSGDIWLANDAHDGVSEVIGVAVPVVTPISAGLVTPYTYGSRP